MICHQRGAVDNSLISFATRVIRTSVEAGQKPAVRGKQQGFLESTLFWTELPKFIPNPEVAFSGPLPNDPAKLLKKVIGEREVQYTYSIRRSIEEEKERKAALDRLPMKS